MMQVGITMKQIVVNDNEYEIKVALLEDDILTEFYVERDDKERMVGNIYKGRVANVLPGMESAFIDIGLERNAFLYVKDLREFEEQYLDGIKNSVKPIEEILKVGDEVILQILKEPRGTKGARVTTHYTIPGRYLVLMPNNDYIAISKKIVDEEERERLKKILQDIKPEGVGVIIRTAGEHKVENDFIREIEYLTKAWKEIESNIKKSKVGECLYKDKNIIERISRDIFTNDIDVLTIDSEEGYWELIDYISAFSENILKMKVKLYQEQQPIFDYYNITPQLNKALNKKVWLKCGGYLIIEKTEALVSIDVNTGKNTGSINLESTVLETNMEAAEEIPKQLRLRNLSGIIIIDFIDMKIEEDQKKVVECLETHLQKDRIKNNVVRFTELGLIEMTRKRIGKELSSYFMDTCPHCNGEGMIKSVDTIIGEIIQEIKEASQESDIKKVILKVGSETGSRIKEGYIDFIDAFLKKNNKSFELIVEPLFEREKTNLLLEK